jgi:hypothetical protein
MYQKVYFIDLIKTVSQIMFHYIILTTSYSFLYSNRCIKSKASVDRYLETTNQSFSKRPFMDFSSFPTANAQQRFMNCVS